MQSDLYSCCICSILYDRAAHIPKLLPTCGHTFCSGCLTLLLDQKKNSCPLDRIAFPLLVERTEQFPTNLLILQVIEEKTKTEFQTCTKHNSLKDLVCVTDHSYVCKDCAAEDHKNHAVKTVKEIKAESQTKTKKLQAILDEFKSQESEIDMVIIDTKKSLTTCLKNKFDDMRNSLHQKEKEIFKEVELCLENKRKEIDLKLTHDRNLKSRLQAQICDLDANIMNQRFFRTLLAKIPSFKSKCELGHLLKTTQELRHRHETEIEAFKTLLDSIIKEFSVSESAPFFDDDDEIWEDELDLKMESIMDSQNSKTSLADVRSLLDIDIKDNVAVINLRVPGENNNLEFCGLPDMDALKKVKGINLFLEKDHLTKHSLGAMKSLWSAFEEVPTLAIYFSYNFNDEDLLLLISDPFWVSEKIKIFSLANSKTVVQDLVSTIAGSLSQVDSIQSGNASQSYASITEKSLKNFGGQILPKLKNLQFLVLDLGFTLVNDAAVVELLLGARQISENLNVFILGLNYTKITDKTIEMLSEEFCLHSLEKFGLFLKGCHITDASVKSLCSKLKNFLKKVKSVVLDLSHTKVTNKGVSAIGKDILTKATSLEKLEISLKGLHVTDFSLKKFLTHLGKSIQALKSFRLCLNKTKVSDETLEYLVKQALPSIAALESFSLELDSTQVSDSSFQMFCPNLKLMMKNLEYFLLSIRETKITGKSVEALINSVDFTSLTKLKKFEVHIDECQVNLNVQNRLSEISSQLAKPVKYSLV